MHPMLNIAIRAARAAGEIIIRYIDRIEDSAITEKGRGDFTTEIDRQAEIAIIKILQKAYPQHAFLAEENKLQKQQEYLWLIDPLDGTRNYIHGIPQYAVSIALQHRGLLQQAVIYDPIQQELFTASRGKGARINNRRIRVNNKKYLQDALIGVSSPCQTPQQIDSYLLGINQLAPLTSAGIRQTGTTALDLAYVACARLDAVWGIGLQSWDMAAGMLLIEEAGGINSSINDTDQPLQSGNIISANPAIHMQISKALKNMVINKKEQKR